jgi:hypothetical protein
VTVVIRATNHLAAHVREEPAHGPDVGEVGDIRHGVVALREERGGHGGQRGVLGARDLHLTPEGNAAFDDDLVHPSFRGGRGF